MDKIPISSLLIISVAVCAGLAALGFRGRVTTVGIDLGTTFSVVGIALGNGSVLIIGDELGRVLQPSVVSFLDGGDVAVGYDALDQLQSNPRNTIYNAKRFMSQRYTHELSQFVNDTYGFRVKPDANGDVVFDLQASGHPASIQPQQIGAYVLNHLLAYTHSYLGHNQVRSAVIAVPAKFNSEQRQATAIAFKMAGLKVTRVLEEPVAAAVAYGLHKSGANQVMVYDFGGGTLDVSLLLISNGAVSVYASEGDDELGGSDFDHCMTSLISSKVKKVTGELHMKDHVRENSQSGVKTSPQCTEASMRTIAEETKKRLSFSRSALVQCKHTTSAGVNIDVEVGVTREEFESDCSRLFDRAMMPVERLLSELNMQADEVDEVVCVGGSTRMPKVKEMLRKRLGNAKLRDDIDPDVTVAYGAASIID